MALWENVIGYGTHADRPAAGAPGALYCESDTGLIVRDNGTTWDTVAGTRLVPRFAVQTMSGSDVTIAEGNTLLINTGTGQTVTLPGALDALGQSVIIKNMAPAATCLIAPASGDTLESDATSPYHEFSFYGAALLVSDGTVWYIIGHMAAP